MGGVFKTLLIHILICAPSASSAVNLTNSLFNNFSYISYGDTTNYIQIVLDSSENMNSAVNGQRKIDLAISEANRVIQKISTDISGTPIILSLRTFGSESNQCGTSKLLYPFKQLNVARLTPLLRTLSPKGKSSISNSLHQSKTDFPKDPNVIKNNYFNNRRKRTVRQKPLHDSS